MYMLRKAIEHKVSHELGLTDDDVFFASLSSRTLVYKGQLTPAQVRFLPPSDTLFLTLYMRAALGLLICSLIRSQIGAWPCTFFWRSQIGEIRRARAAFRALEIAAAV